jgi:hypothetical protein
MNKRFPVIVASASIPACVDQSAPSNAYPVGRAGPTSRPSRPGMGNLRGPETVLKKTFILVDPNDQAQKLRLKMKKSKNTESHRRATDQK